MIDIFYFDKTLKRGEVKDFGRLKNKRIWIDITNITKKEAELMKTAFGLHPLTVEDLFHTNTRVKIEEFKNYLFCVFYSLQKNKNSRLIELDFILGENFIITNHQKEIVSFSNLKNNKEKVADLFKEGVDFIFHKLLDDEVDHYLPVLEDIDEQIGDIEEEITKKPRPKLLKKVLELKRKIIFIKKSAFPQRENISSLTKNDYRFISKKAIPYFRDIYDHSIRVFDSIENCREAAANSFDVYMSAVSNSMNEVMKVLSIIATIALPLTVISGIWGTNFRMLPGLGVAYGFWLMILAMVLLSIGMLCFFKRRGWF